MQRYMLHLHRSQPQQQQQPKTACTSEWHRHVFELPVAAASLLFDGAAAAGTAAVAATGRAGGSMIVASKCSTFTAPTPAKSKDGRPILDPIA
jgi:hypothetical protein